VRIYTWNTPSPALTTDKEDGREREEKGGKEEHGPAVFRGDVVFMCR
jgi:hypothetical protein